jgi:hypothetical protein
VKTQKDVNGEIRAIRERVRGFSGYWLGEASAAIQALEWVIEKRNIPPSEDIGKTGGEHERIAAGLAKAVEKAPAEGEGAKAAKPAAAGPKPTPKKKR